LSARPNIIFVMPDELRHDALAYAGNPVIETPNLDALAARGVTLRGAHCESPVCQPSRVSILSGLFPRDHGCFDNDHLRHDFVKGVAPGPEVGTFAQRLQAAGYYTAVVGKVHMRNPHPRPDLVAEDGIVKAYGFDHVVEELDKGTLISFRSHYTDHLRERGLFDAWADLFRQPIPIGPDGRPLLSVYAPEQLAPEDTLDGFIGQHAARFVREYEREQPFFLWVTFVGPHPPFDAPAAFSDRYEPERIPRGPLGFDALPENRWGEYLRFTRPGLEVPDERVGIAGKYYYGNISLIDAQIGNIVDALAATGRDRDTWIVFASDHGELLGDHGRFYKSVFFESSVRVPGLVVPPAGPSAFGPRVIDGLTQNLDLTATILDLAGCAWLRDSGQSLLPAFDGADVSRVAVFSEIAGFLMVATEQHKLVVDEGSRQPQSLHDLDVDPDERTNVLGDRAHRAVVENLMDEHALPFLARAPRRPRPARRWRKAARSWARARARR
jgi:choline-sulfatase